MRLISKSLASSFLAVTAGACLAAFAQQPATTGPAPNPLIPPAPHAKTVHLKHVLVIGQTKGWEHDSISAAMAAIYNMGKESGLWDTMLRTDTELLTKKDPKKNNIKNLDYFDVIVFCEHDRGARSR